jgi:hypothetical protein
MKGGVLCRPTDAGQYSNRGESDPGVRARGRPGAVWGSLSPRLLSAKIAERFGRNSDADALGNRARN